jgi:hypothetical protein
MERSSASVGSGIFGVPVLAVAPVVGGGSILKWVPIRGGRTEVCPGEIFGPCAAARAAASWSPMTVDLRVLQPRARLSAPIPCAQFCAYDSLEAVGKARESLTLLGLAWAQETPPHGGFQYRKSLYLFGGYILANPRSTYRYLPPRDHIDAIVQMTHAGRHVYESFSPIYA